MGEMGQEVDLASTCQEEILSEEAVEQSRDDTKQLETLETKIVENRGQENNEADDDLGKSEQVEFEVESGKEKESLQTVQQEPSSKEPCVGESGQEENQEEHSQKKTLDDVECNKQIKINNQSEDEMQDE